MPRWRARAKADQRPTYTFSESFATQDPDLVVTAEISVRWRQLSTVDPHTDVPAVLRSHLREIVSEAVGREPATRAHVAQDSVNARIGMPQRVEPTSVFIVWAKAVLIVAPEVYAEAADRERARQHARRRMEELANEIKHVDAFRSQVLADPGMAMAYWFMRNPGQATEEQTIKAIERLSQRVASYSPENAWVQISRVLQEFVAGLSEADRRDSLDVIRKWLERYDGERYLRELPDPEQAP